MRDVGTVTVAHLQPHDPLVGWAERSAMIQTDLVLTGDLTGSIDLVLRIDDADRPEPLRGGRLQDQRPDGARPDPPCG